MTTSRGQDRSFHTSHHKLPALSQIQIVKGSGLDSTSTPSRFPSAACPPPSSTTSFSAAPEDTLSSSRRFSGRCWRRRKVAKLVQQMEVCSANSYDPTHYPAAPEAIIFSPALFLKEGYTTLPFSQAR